MAVESYEYSVVDYIVKPVNYERFLISIQKAVQLHKMRNVFHSISKDEFFIKSGTTLIKVDLNEILWIEAMENYVSINTEKEKITLLNTIKQLESKLPKNEFIRMHRSQKPTNSSVNLKN